MIEVLFLITHKIEKENYLVKYCMLLPNEAFPTSFIMQLLYIYSRKET